jgi:hypothetical protein
LTPPVSVGHGQGLGVRLTSERWFDERFATAGEVAVDDKREGVAG